MKIQKKQSLLTVIITILVIALIMLVGSIVYEEKINISKRETQNTVAPVENEQEQVSKEQEKEENSVEDIPVEDAKEEEIIEDKDEYVGEEEQVNDATPTDTTKSKDEKAIELAQKEWGEDNSVTFNVEEKKEAKYYVAVKREATVVQWYEVDTETWKISEF